jgi:fatty acid desaturase
MDHHYWSGNFEQDPTMAIVKKMREGQGIALRVFDAIWKSGVPLMALNQHVVFWSKSYSLTHSVGQKVRLVLGMALWLAVTGTLVVSGFGFHFAASFMVYLVMVETINFPHHLDLPQLEGENRLQVWDQYKVSRTCLYSPILAKFLLLNFNYHVEHHLFPTLPYESLPQAHELITQALRAEGKSMNLTQGNAWILKNRKRPLLEVFVGPILRESRVDLKDQPVVREKDAA